MFVPSVFTGAAASIAIVATLAAILAIPEATGFIRFSMPEIFEFIVPRELSFSP